MLKPGYYKSTRRDGTPHLFFHLNKDGEVNVTNGGWSGKLIDNDTKVYMNYSGITIDIYNIEPDPDFKDQIR